MTENSLSFAKKKKEKLDVFSQFEVEKIQAKLSNEDYIYNAIYCLASIITDRILNGGGKIEGV
ncbi:MAG: hypothetical protein ACTTKH_08175 [Treponema sp.]